MSGTGGVCPFDRCGYVFRKNVALHMKYSHAGEALPEKLFTTEYDVSVTVQGKCVGLLINILCD